jgi:hypothetical protein
MLNPKSIEPNVITVRSAVIDFIKINPEIKFLEITKGDFFKEYVIRDHYNGNGIFDLFQTKDFKEAQEAWNAFIISYYDKSSHDIEDNFVGDDSYLTSRTHEVDLYSFREYIFRRQSLRLHTSEYLIVKPHETNDTEILFQCSIPNDNVELPEKIWELFKKTYNLGELKGVENQKRFNNLVDSMPFNDVFCDGVIHDTSKRSITEISKDLANKIRKNLHIMDQ